MKRRNPNKIMNQTSFRISVGPSPDEMPSELKSALRGSIVIVNGGLQGPPPTAVNAAIRIKYELPKVKLLKTTEVILGPKFISARDSFPLTSTCKKADMIIIMLNNHFQLSIYSGNIFLALEVFDVIEFCLRR